MASFHCTDTEQGWEFKDMEQHWKWPVRIKRWTQKGQIVLFRRQEDMRGEQRSRKRGKKQTKTGITANFLIIKIIKEQV